MKRPLGVTVIASFCILAGAYLLAVAVVILIAPGKISTMTGAPLMYGLELAGPYMTLLVGAGWVLVGWGLFRLHNWARWVAMIASILGIALIVPKVSAAADFRQMLVAGGLNITLRAAVVWYLLQSPSVFESFTKK
ncbi:MAG: hypothetical protein WAN60_17380 [Candidatus Sulfotelmatobacter sp.]